MKYNDLMDTNSILNLLTTHLQFSLRQRGKNIFFLCLFHDDKSPSLCFEPKSKFFKCFACGFSARNIFEFWVKYRKGAKTVTAAELRQAAREISQLGYFAFSDWQEEEPEEDRLNIFFSLVKDIYQHNLLTFLGRKILNYLQNQRQLTPQLIDRFSLGCSINNKQLINLLFSHQEFSAGLLQTNLGQINNNNQAYDYFAAHQLIFPLTNENGKIVAFASRKITVGPEESKYNYLSNYQTYQKSALLYNYAAAQQNRAEDCYLVEGFFDVISLTGLGVENCVALLGTNCSTKQVQLLRQLKKRIILFLDGDRAGREATINIALALLEKEIDCEIISHSYQGDPDEICRQEKSEQVFNILQTRQNPYLFILDYYFRQWEIADNPQRVTRFIEEIARLFAPFKTNIKYFLVNKTSLLTGWNKEEVEVYFVPRHLPIRHISDYCWEMLFEQESRLISLCIQERKFWLIISQHNYFFWNQSHRQYYQKIYNHYIASSQHQTLLSSSSSNIKEDPNHIIQKINIISNFLFS